VDIATVLAWAVIIGFLVIVALITVTQGGWFTDNLVSCLVALIVLGAIVSYVWTSLVGLLERIFG